MLRGCVCLYICVKMLIMEQVVESKGISARAYAVCEGIKTGLSVKKAALKFGGYEPQFYKELYENPALEELYLRARATRAHAHFEAIAELKDDLRAGVIDSNIARVELAAIQWQAGKEKPKVYGEKQIPDVQVNISLAGALDAAIALRDAVPVISAPEVIEAEVIPDKRSRIAESLL